MAPDSQERAHGEELEVLTQVLSALQKLDSESRERILDTIATFFGVARNSVGAQATTAPADSPRHAPQHIGLFSEDRTISPKQFILENQPATDVERVACLAYYLTHYRNTPYFKTLDISKLNTEAAQIKFSNATVAVDNATKSNYLVPATKGNKQLSALGEQFVLALPDREKARAVMSQGRPRRKTRRTGTDTALENHAQTGTDESEN
jgi:hypothetical protein